ncbi:SoxY-related AACIE arm protein [Reyranella aquatilis]|jgi:sulfur-oxidizing protein SoxY|uniref:SoxY-related AACIE arm protein n=1 Tax=Reyranella aquatilis TaxID=2035356 RepID=A0ABS8KVY6_9HYPH|nr:SoxY-related AACIE arm protein [Reyranella aquatilis]MCC8429751.1 SoxY-related AACIE arm protein [Reyranella aquatilis]
MDRRRFLTGTTAAVLVLPLAPASATQEAMAEAIRKVVGTATPTEGRVKLDVPPLVENGSTVPLTVTVESPMSEADHVKAIHVFNEKNPQPNVFSARLGPRNGKAVVGTRVKLGDSQRIIAIAETSDGRFWSGGADVIVTLAACLEESP